MRTISPLALVATIAAATLAAVASPAEAHVLGSAEGFVQGFAHPVSGLDHVLAMVAVGVWAAGRGGTDLWRMPAAFVSTMLAGALAAAVGLALPFGELGIAGSLVLFGLVIGLGARLRGALGAVLVGAFAVFHGQAHGIELEIAADPVAFAIGFMLSTTSLHLAGIGIGLAVERSRTRLAFAGLRAAGALVAVVGATLLMGP
ncbi:MAG: HupE/UreJ family protein [Alphaproteobacteria bacterium]